ncbi:EpsG family protein [Vibrio lentus]
MLYFIIYGFSWLLAGLSSIKKLNFVFLSSIFIALVSFASLRGPGVDKDYYNYEHYWFVSFVDAIDFFKEPVSKALFIIPYELGLDFSFSLFLFAFISLLLKLYVVKKLELPLIIFISVYVGFFYVQHEMTQLRVSLAVGFYLVSFFSDSKAIRIIFLILSLLSHSSVFILLLGRVKLLWRKGVVIVLMMVSVFLFLLAVLGLNVSSVVNFIVSNFSLLSKYQFYFGGTWGQQDFNLLSATNISIILLSTFCSLLIIRKSENNSYELAALSQVWIGILAIPLLASIPVAAFRVSQLYLVFYPYVLAMSFNLMFAYIKDNNIYKVSLSKFSIFLFMGLYGAVLMYVVVIRSEVIYEYYTIFK